MTLILSSILALLILIVLTRILIRMVRRSLTRTNSSDSSNGMTSLSYDDGHLDVPYEQCPCSGFKGDFQHYYGKRPDIPEGLK